MAKPKHTNTVYDSRSDLLNDDSELVDDVRIGGSPLPGWTLQHILQGHKSQIVRLAWSLDGVLLASPSFDKTIHIWNVKNGDLEIILRGQDAIGCVAWSPNGNLLVSGSKNGLVHIWDYRSERIVQTFKGHTALIRDVSWSPDGNSIVSSSDDL